MVKNLSLLPGARLLVQLYTQLSGIVKAINNQNNVVVSWQDKTEIL